MKFNFEKQKVTEYKASIVVTHTISVISVRSFIN